jgi:hypothetical protein
MVRNEFLGTASDDAGDSLGQLLIFSVQLEEVGNV